MRKSLITVLALFALPLAAQNVDIEALSGLQFNFGNPGARSLGMGGAFLGLADDASAAEANPAGLTILRKPEVSLEVRNYLEQQLFTTTGTFPDVVRTPFTHHSDRAVLSFASFVYPVKNFTFGAYFHEPLNNEGGGIGAPRQMISRARSRRSRTSICRPEIPTARPCRIAAPFRGCSASNGGRKTPSLHLFENRVHR